MANFCTKCGTKNLGGMQFCPTCGERFEDSFARNPNNGPEIAREDYNRATRQTGYSGAAYQPGGVAPAKKPVLIIVLCIVGGVILISLIIFLLLQSLKTDTKEAFNLSESIPLAEEYTGEKETPVLEETKPESGGMYIFYDSDSRYLNESDLASLNIFELSIARNEIYARHGYIFSENQEMIDHFGAQPWYKGTESSQEEVSKNFNTYEKKNVAFISDFEKGYSQGHGDGGFYMFWDSDIRYLTRDDLAYLSKYELSIARNEIYARHGYIFSSNQAMKDHFNSQSWYHGTESSQDVVSRQFNRYEKDNVALILECEKLVDNYVPDYDAYNYFVFPYSDSVYLSEGDLAYLSKFELAVARNEIYARHGYIFSKNKEMADHFASMPWYYGSETDQEKVRQYFNDCERHNVDLIAAYEKR